MRPHILRAVSEIARKPPPRTTWQVKVSTLCNLRCRYCYEWDRLGDRSRLTLPQWRRVIEAARDLRRIRQLEVAEDVLTTLVWHGGEPLLHPAAYVSDVLALQKELLGERTAGSGEVRNAVQTNLTRDGESLALMVGTGFLVSVSADFGSGVRVDAAGRETDARVRANLERLARSGAKWGVALVLGQHNREHLEAVHDALATMGANWLRIIPMFAPPSTAPGRDLLLAPEEVVGSLARLFVHWLKREARLPVHPFHRVVRTALRRLGGQSDDLDLRRHVRLVVHPDGTLTEQGGSAVPTVRLGNVFTQRMEEIVRSAAWRARPQRAEALRARHCATCAYREACDGRPAFEHPHPLPQGPCPIESRLCAWAEDFLAREGVVGCDEAVWSLTPSGP